ncbi:SRPBCC family protein [Phycicoccus sp. CSK15P-2]|uniref:SRPBCC family protein n=1 Tax=Phycicoccus sp. CSK15P-2 TaxID=2807627 RepID=UPI00194F8DF8|nr:SRPBCC family protein [Phycicoccus sp. CSK15P-2]MBM6405590.1 SRPBCC family protein [Phycicoccus sp. CSK15P-2]
MSDLSCTYTIYLAASAEEVWDAFTDPDRTGTWWGHRNESDWQEGSDWTHVRADRSGDDGGGTVLESRRPSRLAFTFPTGEPSTVSFDIVEHGDIVRLTMNHTDLPNEQIQGVVSKVWPAILSNLKSYLEGGSVMPSSPLEAMDA